ncbi:MAG TPA: nucleotidyltransferase domain-containing protein, partial [Burkholderiaceae bacterium]|nr:nucleotidyltransferase domain-containing protein [Burkholderiaceae bacterium]
MHASAAPTTSFTLVDLARDLRSRLKADREAAITRFQHDRSVARLLPALRRHVDQAVVAAAQALSLPRSCALIAVGGFGRGELFPYSDVDLLILLSEPLDDATSQRVADFVSVCWDIGLEVGHSVRTVAECLQEAERDITVQTSVLECRYLSGSHAAYSQLKRGLNEAMDPKRFFQAKMLEMRQRHARFQDTPYSLEPNCKESPGGLRDLQVILWVARAAGLGTSWRALRQHGLITSEEESALIRNERVLKTIRAQLHILSKRREDRLVFDVQTALAEALGFKPAGTRRVSEVLMQRYYWAAKAVVQLNRILLQNIEQRIFEREDAPAQQIDAHFNNVNDLLDIARDDVFEREPATMLEAFRVMQQHPELKGMSTRTLRALWHARNRI